MNTRTENILFRVSQAVFTVLIFGLSVIVGIGMVQGDTDPEHYKLEITSR